MKRLKIIVAASERDALEGLVHVVNWASLGNHEVLTSKGIRETEKLLASTKPDILVLRFAETPLKELPFLKKDRDFRVVAISNNTSYESLRSALLLGLDDYIREDEASHMLGHSLVEIIDKINYDDDEVIKIPHSTQNTVVAKAIEYVEKNYSKSFEIGKVESYAGETEVRFPALFREETGMNFLRYLNSYRVNKAAELLRGTPARITDIGRKTGFTTASYFTKTFRKYMGMKPSEWRQLSM